jgi:hypothetical protein
MQPSQDSKPLDFYYVPHNKQVYQHDFQSAHCQVFSKVPFMSKPRVVYTPSNQVFVIGGTDLNNQVTGKCYRVQHNLLKEIHPMLQARSSFGCCVTQDAIFIAGGILPGKMQAVGNCEVYDINDNKWLPLASLPVGAFSISLSIYNQNNLLAVGGTDDMKRHLSQIWMLNLSDDSKWQRINVTLPFPLTSAGMWQN